MKNWITVLIMILSACNGFKVDRILKKSSPYESYLQSLEASGLENSALVRDWKQAGEKVLEDSLLISLPYHEISYMEAGSPKALMLQFAVNEGSEIHVNLEPFTQKDSQFFMDIFAWEIESKAFKRLYSSDSTNQIHYQVSKSGIHALRVQPELFRGGVFALNIESRGVLAFPIPGKTSRNISSFWGDPRDANVRKHEGIDIFAPRGTPVLAVSDGRVRRVGTNRLGGNVVWLNNSKMGHSQYYAHLDSHAVSVGQGIKTGDTLGFVGNTGNAITTAPHLHFGIYKSGQGAVDPLNFVREAEKAKSLPPSDSLKIGRPGIITARIANIRTQPNTHSEIIGSFPQNTYLRLEGKTGDWFRIELPDNQKGFIYSNLAKIVEKPLATINLSSSDQIQEDWLVFNTVSGEIIAGEAMVWGVFGDGQLVETSSGIQGWMLGKSGALK